MKRRNHSRLDLRRLRHEIARAPIGGWKLSEHALECAAERHIHRYEILMTIEEPDDVYVPHYFPHQLVYQKGEMRVWVDPTDMIVITVGWRTEPEEEEIA